MKHPLDAIHAWFQSLHQPDKNWAAVRLVSALPIDDEDMPFDALTNGEQLLENWLAVRGVHTQDVGRVIATRALISFVLIRDAEQESYWQELQKRQRLVLQHLEDSGDAAMAQKMQDRLLDMPRLEASWREAAGRWNTLVEGALSDSALAAWSAAEESGGPDDQTRQ